MLINIADLLAEAPIKRNQTDRGAECIKEIDAKKARQTLLNCLLRGNNAKHNNNVWHFCVDATKKKKRK